MRAFLGIPVCLALAVPCFARAGQTEVPQPPARGEFTEVAMSPPVMPRTAPARVVSTRTAPRTGGHEIAVADPATQCETAVTTAEFVYSLPPRLLAAISLTESARIDAASGKARPWPWTINAEGEGQFFETRQAAVAAVKALQDRGVRSIDAGCLQVNLMYHPGAFASLEDAFDPRINANYAARFLNSLYADSKNWASAVAAYHSETPALGDAYRVLVMARWQNGDPHTLITRRVAYGDFVPGATARGDQIRTGGAYGAFAPSSLVYGAFAPR